MAKNIRNVSGNNIQDPGILHNLEYNDAAGSKKVSEVGRHLLPIPFISAGALAYSTDASSAARVVPNQGRCLAIYNNDTAVHSITLGEDNTVVALGAGVTDANGHVGIPCIPNSWTYVACAQQQWIKTDNVKLLVFLIDDNSQVAQESK